MEVGPKIKSYLEQKGIAQAHISRVTNIPCAKLNLALNGKRRMTFGEYELVCGALDLGTDFFLEAKKPI